MGDITPTQSLCYVRNYRCEDIKIRHKYSRGSSDGVILAYGGSGGGSGSGRSSPAPSYVTPRVTQVKYNGSNTHTYSQQLSYFATVGIRVGFQTTSRSNSRSQLDLSVPPPSSGRGLSLSRYYPGLSKANSVTGYGGGGRCNSADPDLSRRFNTNPYAVALTTQPHHVNALVNVNVNAYDPHTRSRRSPFHSNSQTPTTRSNCSSRSGSVERQSGRNNGHNLSNGGGGIGWGTKRNGFSVPVTELARNVSSYNWERGGGGEDDIDSGYGLLRAGDYYSRQSSCAGDSDSTLLGSRSTSISTSRSNIWPSASGSTVTGVAVAVAATTTSGTDLESFVSFSRHHNGKDVMMNGGGGGRRRGRRSIYDQGYQERSNFTFVSTLTTEEEGTLARAEARLAARRQARAEAREIRMKELEKQQKESDDSADRNYDMYAPGGGIGNGGPPPLTPIGGGSGGGAGDVVNRAAFRVALGPQRSSTHSGGSASYHSSRRSSEDSSEDGVINMRELRHDLKETEEKFRKSMVQNAQLDNEKAALTYQVELLKDKIEDLEESLSLLGREYKDKSRDFENLKRLSTQIKDELEYYKSQLKERDELIKEYGLVLVENEIEVDVGDGVKERRIKRTLVSQETADVLSKLGQGSLDVRLNRVMDEKNELQDEINRLKLELEEERSSKRGGGLNNNVSNHLDDGENETEISKQIAEYRFKTQKSEQEIAALLANVTRLDTQVQRFKTAAEEAEAREDDLKVERRKLQRELREAQSKLDELETTNSHLQKRLDKLKTAKSTLLKEL